MNNIDFEITINNTNQQSRGSRTVARKCLEFNALQWTGLLIRNDLVSGPMS